MLYHGSLVHSILDVDRDLKVVESPAGSKRMYECEIHPLLKQPVGTFYSYTLTDPFALSGTRDLFRMALFVPKFIGTDQRAKLLLATPDDQHAELHRLWEKTCQLTVAINKERSNRQIPVFSEDVSEDVDRILSYFNMRGQGGSRQVIHSEGQITSNNADEPAPIPVEFTVRFEPVSASHTLIHIKTESLLDRTDKVLYEDSALLPTLLLECAFKDVHRTATAG